MADRERLIFLDTETTGLDPRQGHRLIEVAAVEAVERRLTGRAFHRYLNPGRDIDAAALEVHGISAESLQDKPTFSQIAPELIEFIAGSRLCIHNAAFDVAFLDAELRLAGFAELQAYCPEIIDTLELARSLFPGKRNSLDALCERLGINHAQRVLHGALVDARLLAEAYFAMTRGQAALDIDSAVSPMVLDSCLCSSVDAQTPTASRVGRPRLRRICVSEAQRLRHLAYLDGLDRTSRSGSLWRR
ncbi:MAG: DNA polymerase III subunit epsilon [Casimicrobiaceae bacterium]|nr:DNA polymerase III subunit epsilon [Casimicrobiaceae bacterium]MCX8098414.1 DNA polymerase III subunit epsilon [Casimicrobiaceae bacterium]MDW8311126.1 DNA polymerase III subunit epsilon [Burkholderiales bacterium]